MQNHPLGNTDLSVTRIGLGLAALGRPGYINLGHSDDLEAEYSIESMEARAHQVLDAAWQAGVRFFDAARSYGRAEAFLSSWLESKDLPDSMISSKWGYTYTADWQIQAEAHEVKDHSLDVLNRQIKESRELLGDHLNLYQIHSATLESGVLDNLPILARLNELKNSGFKIGLSVSGPNQSDVIRKAMTIEFDGCTLFDTCQATWNLLETSATSALQEAHDSGVGIIIKEGLANGRLTSRNTSKEFSAQREILEALAERHQTTIDAIALANILSQPWVDTVLSGAASQEHIRSNLSAINIELTKSDLESLISLSETPLDYWQTRAGLAWN